MTLSKSIKTSLLLLALALPVGFAQEFYLGAALGNPFSSVDDVSTPLDVELGAQLGIDFLPSLGIRAAVEGNPENGRFELASGDAIFRFYLPLSPNSVYTGLGADVYFADDSSAVIGPPSEFLDSLEQGDLAVHALAGLEFRLGRFGLFAEALPSYVVGEDTGDSDSYFLRARGGLNFHF